MSLFDLLACPVCKAPVVRVEEQLTCRRCSRVFPIVNGVPIMLTQPDAALVPQEDDLRVRQGYSAGKDRVVLQSLTPDRIVLDFGSGRQALDDPCIVRMDLTLSPYVDVVGDVQALPFLPDSIDYALGDAVMEHVPRPWQAVDELWRVLKPGGYVYADWNFLVAYHGHPHHYYNATLRGLHEAFARFETIDVGVAPYHGPSYALLSIISTYLKHFKAESRLEREFAYHLSRVLWFPLDEFDERLDSEHRFRVAASGYFVGVKRPAGTESILPPVVLEAYSRDPALQQRFPAPLDLSRPDNLLRWARTDGAARDPAIRGWIETLRPFNKHGDGQTFARRDVDAWPVELTERRVPIAEADYRARKLWESHSLWFRLRDSNAREGPAGMIKAVGPSLRRTSQAARVLFSTLRKRFFGR
jgi:uncharacterized protein YbaR (Trm112 family)/SAM-dependent methyltransferase